MTKLGIIVLFATLTVLVAEWLRCRRRPFPAYGWAGLGLLALAEWLMFRGVQPVATYFTPIAWTCYLLVADAALRAVCGRSRLSDAPLEFARLALLSIPLWLIFEAYNLRLANWTYVGLPRSLPARWFGYGWSFATIFPAILLTADLLESFGWWSPSRPLRFSSAARRTFIVLGALFLLLPLVLPRSVAAYLFGMVWLGFIFLLDPVNFRLGLPSLQADLAAGRRGRLFSLLAAGWVCGWLWEFWNSWASAKWLYIFPILSDKKVFEMPLPGYLGFLPFALECFVMSTFAAWASGWLKPVPPEAPRLHRPAAERPPDESTPVLTKKIQAAVSAALSLAFFAVLLLPAPARAAGLVLPPAATQGLELLYSGQTEKAAAAFHQMSVSQPDDPLGYLLEADARWWQIFCESCEIKYNTIDTWQRPRTADDDSYLALADKAVRLAEARIAQRDSADMELYAGMGLLLRARLLGLRDDRRGTARAGVQGRAHLLRCLALDPQMADAYTGLGLYNYYVDTLSTLARILRVFMGIPGGKKQDGVRELRMAMQDGVLTRVEARFYLAKNLRNYDRDYAASIEAMTPLVAEYPLNPAFQLILGDTHAKLGHSDLAAASFRAAMQIIVSDAACARRIHEVAAQALALLAPGAKPSIAQPDVR